MNQLMTPTNANSIVTNGIRENSYQPMLDIIAPKSLFRGSIVWTGTFGTRVLQPLIDTNIQDKVAQQITREFTTVNDWQQQYPSNANGANMAKIVYVTNYLLALYRTIRFSDTNFSTNDLSAQDVARFISSVLQDLYQQNFINDVELYNIILNIPGTANHYNNPNLAIDAITISNVLRNITTNGRAFDYQNAQEYDLTPGAWQPNLPNQQPNNPNPQQQGYWHNGQWYQGQPLQQPITFQPAHNFQHQGGGHNLTQQQQIPPTSECCKEEETMEDLNAQLLKLQAQLEPLKPINITINQKKPKDPAIYDDIYQDLVSKMFAWLEGNDGYVKDIGDDKDQIIIKQIEKFYDEEVAKHSAKELSPTLSKGKDEFNKQRQQIVKNVQKCIEIKYDYVNHFFENSTKYLAIGGLKDGEKSKKLQSDIENATQLFRNGKKGDAKRAMQTILKESANEETKGFFYSFGKFLGSVFSSDGYDIDEVLKTARKVDSELFEKWKILDIEREDVEKLALLPDDKKPKEFMHKAKHRKYTNYYWEEKDLTDMLADDRYREEDKIKVLDDLINDLKGVKDDYVTQIEELIFQGKGDGKDLFSANEPLFGKIKFGDEDGEFDNEAPSAIKDIFTVGVSGTSMYVPVPSIITDIRNSMSNVFIHPIQESLDYRDVRVAWMDNIKSKLPDSGKVEDLRMITDFEIIATLGGGHNGFYKDFKNTSSGGDMKQIINMVFTYSAVTFPEPVKDLEAFIDKLSSQYGYNRDNLIQIYEQTKKEARDILMARATNIIHDRVGIDKIVATKKTLSNLAYEKNEPVNSISYSEQKVQHFFQPVPGNGNYSNVVLNTMVGVNVKTELDDYVIKRIDLLKKYGFDVNDIRGNIDGNTIDINLHPNLDGNNIMIDRIINNQDPIFLYKKGSDNTQNAHNNSAQADNIISYSIDHFLKNKFYDNNGKLKDEYTIEQYREAINAMNELKPDNLSKHIKKWGRENFGKITSKAVASKIPLEGHGTVILASKPNVDIELPDNCVTKDGMIYGDKLYDFLSKTQKNLCAVNIENNEIVRDKSLSSISLLNRDLIDKIADELSNEVYQNNNNNLSSFQMSRINPQDNSIMRSVMDGLVDMNQSILGISRLPDINEVVSLDAAARNIANRYGNNDVLNFILGNMFKHTENLSQRTLPGLKEKIKDALIKSVDDFNKQNLGLYQKNGKYYINPQSGKLAYAQTRELKDCKTVDEAVLFLRKLKDGYLLEAADGKGHSNQNLRNYITNATDNELKSLVYVMAEDKLCPSISPELRKSLEMAESHKVMGYDNTKENEIKESIQNVRERMDLITESKKLDNNEKLNKMPPYNDQPYTGNGPYKTEKYNEFHKQNQDRRHNPIVPNRKPVAPIIGG
jgi:hypothetical protein